MTKINLIAAAGLDNTIGSYGKIPWRMPVDMKHFKKLTMDHTIIMGRKTFESMASRPLVGRKSIVLTSKDYKNYTDVNFCKTIEEAENLYKELPEIFIIGGSEIYNQYIDKSNKIFLTRIHGNFGGDTFFPNIDPSKWKETKIEHHSSNERNDYNYSFIEYERI